VTLSTNTNESRSLTKYICYFFLLIIIWFIAVYSLLPTVLYPRPRTTPLCHFQGWAVDVRSSVENHVENLPINFNKEHTHSCLAPNYRLRDLAGPAGETMCRHVFCRISVIKTGILPSRERISCERATKLHHARECDCRPYQRLWIYKDLSLKEICCEGSSDAEKWSYSFSLYFYMPHAMEISWEDPKSLVLPGWVLITMDCNGKTKWYNMRNVWL